MNSFKLSIQKQINNHRTKAKLHSLILLIVSTVLLSALNGINSFGNSVSAESEDRIEKKGSATLTLVGAVQEKEALANLNNKPMIKGSDLIISSSEIKQNEILKVKNRTIVSLAYRVDRSHKLPELLAQVEEAKSKADLVIVYLNSDKTDQQPILLQRDLAKAAIDAGADVIVGNQANRLAPLEFYKDSLILYSLGNFTTDLAWSKAREGIVVSYSWEQEERTIKIYPVWLDKGEPELPSGLMKSYRVNRIYKQLTAGNTTVTNKLLREKDYFVVSEK